AGLNLHAQQVQFSQYYSASLHLNPAIAGIYLTPSFHVGYRRQISNVNASRGSDRFINDLSQTSLILPIKKKDTYGMPLGGIGIVLYNNGAGPGGGLKTNGIMVNYAHNLQIGPVRGKETVVISVQGGFEQQRLSVDALRWGSQFNRFISGGYDETRGVPFLNDFTQSPAYPIINVGAMYYWNIERNFHTYRYSAFSGIAVNNINQPNSSFLEVDENGKLDLLFKYHGGFEFRFRSFDFLPTILGTYENGVVRFNAGGTIAYDLQDTRRFVSANTGMKLALGVWYKWKDSFIFYAGFRSAFLNIGLSYDLSTTGFLNDDLLDFGPATELTLQYFLVKKKRKGRTSANPLF
ncbi:MAG: PorP/SprF family type IX secretion system membrane protein, partial [Bacteroidota bacterium]